MKYMTAEDLGSTPSKLDGISEAKQKQYLFETHQFCTELAKKLGLPYTTISSAMIYFHMYTSKFSFRQFDRFLVVGVCLFLSAKIEYLPIRLEKFIKWYYDLELKARFKKAPTGPMPQDRIEVYRESFTKKEFEILAETGYDLEIELPYDHLKVFKALPGPNTMHVITIAQRFLSDSYILPLCIYHHPKTLVAASMHLALTYASVSGMVIEGIQDDWYKLLDALINIEEVITVANQISELYKPLVYGIKQKQKELSDSKINTKFEQLSSKCLEGSSDIIGRVVSVVGEIERYST